MCTTLHPFVQVAFDCGPDMFRTIYIAIEHRWRFEEDSAFYQCDTVRACADREKSTSATLFEVCVGIKLSTVKIEPVRFEFSYY